MPSQQNNLLSIDSLKRSFVSPNGERRDIVDVPKFSLGVGEQIALRGESGGGKTTFLHLISGILAADTGKIEFQGIDLGNSSESRRDGVRARSIGFIFQTFNLLQGYSCLENVLLGMAFGGKINRAHARALLERVGLSHRLDHYPRQLSVGQQQRVAVARAVAKKPELVLADEPTGNLDRFAADETMKLIRETCLENGSALILVSHDPAVLDSFSDVREFSEINQARAEART